MIEFYQEEIAKIKRKKEIILKELENLKLKLKEGIVLDFLTDLYNETYFIKRLKEELLRAKRYKRIVSILLIEIDKFEQILEFYGAEEEENLLKLLGKNISKQLRRVDIVAKLSKENRFGIILPETPLSGAMVVARKLLRNIEYLIYKNYKISFPIYIAVISYNPLKLDPKRDPEIEIILNALDKGIEVLKIREQKRIISLIIDKKFEIKES